MTNREALKVLVENEYWEINKVLDIEGPYIKIITTDKCKQQQADCSKCPCRTACSAIWETTQLDRYSVAKELKLPIEGLTYD